MTFFILLLCYSVLLLLVDTTTTTTTFVVVTAYTAVRSVFLPINDEVCTTNDSNVIKNHLLYGDSRRRRRRQLRTSQTTIFEQRQRQLVDTTATWCDTVCVGFAPGQCYYWDPQCSGIRRQRRRRQQTQITNTYEITNDGNTTVATNHKIAAYNNNDDDDDSIPSLQQDHRRRLAVNQEECAAEIAAINSGLHDVESDVSAECQDVLAGPRSHTCFETDDICEVLQFDLWNTTLPQSILISDMPDTSVHFCNNDHNFSIVALAESCVDRVEFQLIGPTTTLIRVEAQALYTLFGDFRGVIDNEDDPILPGTYTLTVIPRGQSTFPAQTISFTVDDC